MSPRARNAAEKFARTSYPDEASAIADLTRLIEEHALDVAGPLARALSDAISTYDSDIPVIHVTAERQEAWMHALKDFNAYAMNRDSLAK